ncbi:hypothetical protein MPH_14066, partial [Macrophomina phaseolina MS6]
IYSRLLLSIRTELVRQSFLT